LELKEEVTTYSKLSLSIRSRLLNYVSEIVDKSMRQRVATDKIQFLSQYIAKAEPRRVFETYASIDAASGVLSMNIGFIGLYGSLAVIFPDLKRFFTSESFGIFPENPGELTKFSSPHIFNLALDIRREKSLIVTAIELAREYNVELILLDGPLIPPFNVPMKGDWILARREYVDYVSKLMELIDVCKELGVSLSGFVKRPKSKILVNCSIGDVLRPLVGSNVFDHVIADFILREKGEFFPIINGKLDSVALEFNGRKINVSFVFLKTSRSTSPYRLDIANTAGDKKPTDIISFILSDLTSEGIPFSILKVDEEVKMSKRLMKELYDDVVHSIAYKYGKISLVNLVWGEEL